MRPNSLGAWCFCSESNPTPPLHPSELEQVLHPSSTGPAGGGVEKSGLRFFFNVQSRAVGRPLQVSLPRVAPHQPQPWCRHRAAAMIPTSGARSARSSSCRQSRSRFSISLFLASWEEGWEGGLGTQTLEAWERGLGNRGGNEGWSCRVEGASEGLQGDVSRDRHGQQPAAGVAIVKLR